jgi:hypothetical protein
MHPTAASRLFIVSGSRWRIHARSASEGCTAPACASIADARPHSLALASSGGNVTARQQANAGGRRMGTDYDASSLFRVVNREEASYSFVASDAFAVLAACVSFTCVGKPWEISP